MIKSIIGIVALSFVLSGCGIVYRNAAEDFIKTQPVSAWGEKPPENHQENEVSLIKSVLKDPYSAKFEFLPLERGTVSASLNDPKVVPVYYSTVNVNAKNIYGGYTGFKPYVFHYSNGVLYRVDYSDGGRTYFDKK